MLLPRFLTWVETCEGMVWRLTGLGVGGSAVPFFCGRVCLTLLHGEIKESDIASSRIYWPNGLGPIVVVVSFYCSSWTRFVQWDTKKRFAHPLEILKFEVFCTCSIKWWHLVWPSHLPLGKLCLLFSNFLLTHWSYQIFDFKFGIGCIGESALHDFSRQEKKNSCTQN